jgi:probable F420-dependent oxidoreductase
MIDAIVGASGTTTATAAANAETAGFDGLVVPEVAHDTFIQLAIAAISTERLQLASGIAVAFARNPMSIAITASDLHRLSGGRLTLGLGSQIKAHVTRRFSMTWSDPVAARMREFIEAVRAIWNSWETHTPLRFEGDFYRHTLMTPAFDHGPSPCGWPQIHLAGVGPSMTSLAGEVADGLMCHGFTTSEYLRDVTLPNLAKGCAKADRQRTDIQVSVPVMCVVADGDVSQQLESARSMIAFYGSTPAYRPVLEHHGWGSLGDELHVLSKAGQWSEMNSLIDDDVLNAFYTMGDVDEVARMIWERFGGKADRIHLVGSTHQSQALIAAIRELNDK